MDQIKNNVNHNGQTQTASSTIQSAIDELNSFPSTNNRIHSHTSSKSKSKSIATTKPCHPSSHSNSNTSTSSTLSSIDSTLNALDQQFPFSHDARRQPHPSSLTSNASASTQAKNDALARQLGSFSSASLANPLSPGLSHPYNPLTHWGGVGLRNPYVPYGAARSATKTAGSAKDSSNPRKKSYEDKMDKQRLEHILFSGDNLTGALNQTKERMRQKLQKKNQKKRNGKTNKSKHKKTQSLPNGSNTSHSLLQLDAAKQQKPKRDNGYFLTSISSKPANSPNQNNASNSPKKRTRGNPKGRGNPKRGNPKKGRPKPKNNNPKKGPKKKKKAKNSPRDRSDRRNQTDHNNHHNKADKKTEKVDKADAPKTDESVDKIDKIDKIDNVHCKLDHVNDAFGEQADTATYSTALLSADFIHKQDEIYEEVDDYPDEYFKKHDITPLMQNKLKLEMQQQIPGISIWRDKKELEPLLHSNKNNGYSDYHTNKNPNLLSPSDEDKRLQLAAEEEEDDEEDEDSFVDNFVNVGDTDNENEGDALKKNVNAHSDPSSNSNDSDAVMEVMELSEIYIDPNERAIIDREEESSQQPGSTNTAPEYQYEGVNSNVDLMRYEETLPLDENEEEDTDRLRRNSVIENSRTSCVDGGFDVDAEDEEKHIELKKSVEFDAQGVQRPNDVKYVDEEEEDGGGDLFANMEVNEENVEEKEKVEADAGDLEGGKGEQYALALTKVLSLAGVKPPPQQQQQREEEREKEADEEIAKVKITQIQIQQNEGSKQKMNDKKTEITKKSKKKAKKNSNDTKKDKKSKQAKAENKRKTKKQKQPKDLKHTKEEVLHHTNQINANLIPPISAIEDKEKDEKSAIAQTKPNNKASKSKKGNKRKKRAKKKKHKTKQPNPAQAQQPDAKELATDNGSDDDTTVETLDSSSNAPSVDGSGTGANIDDSGWITKGTKNNKKNQKRHTRHPQSNRISSPTTNTTPISGKSAAKKSPFAYNDDMQVKQKSDTPNKKNKKHHKDHNNHTNHHKHTKPHIKKAKSTSNSMQNRSKSRKERRQNRRQKSDPSLLLKFPSSTIIVPAKHSKTIQTSKMLPKCCKHATSEPSNSKHQFPPLPHKKGVVHFADTLVISKRNGKNKNPNIKLNLSVINANNNRTPTPTSTSTSSLKNEANTTPLSTQSDIGPGPARPTRPPITRLTQPKKDNNMSPPTPPSASAVKPSLSASVSDNFSAPKQTKPPLLLSQRSAPLTSSSANNSNEISTQTNADNTDPTTDPNSQAPLPSGNNSLIASTNTNATHMALYLDESGNLHETPLTLPDIFPTGLPPTAMPAVLGPLGTLPLPPPATNTGVGTDGDTENETDPTQPSLSTLGTIPPLPLNVAGVAGLTLAPLPSALGLASGFLPNLPNLPGLRLPPLPGVPPLTAIPHTIPILLPIPMPMPQFTPEQMAKLNSNLIINNLNTNTTATTTKSVALKPSVPLFKPSPSKMKLEDIKEEDEHENFDSIANDNDKEEAANSNDRSPLIACYKPKSDMECLETFKNDLNKEETEDEWVEIPDLDSTIYPATLWCLNVKSFQAHPQCSLKKLQQSMASALLSS